jgi:hypothetical protein
MPQTSVLDDYVTMLAGMCAYPGRIGVTDEIVVNLAAGIPFGRFVCRDSAGKAKLPTSAGEVTTTGSGISVRDESKEFNSAGWPDKSTMKIARRGYYVVETETAVVKEDAVLVRHTANGGNTVLGRARAGADTGAAAYPNARFVSESAAGLAIVEIM